MLITTINLFTLSELWQKSLLYETIGGSLFG
jgi:hypothetical protein